MELYHGLQKSNFVIRDSKIKSLLLHLDSDGIVKVGGCLRHSTLSYSQHPALLPNKHPFTIILLNFFQRKCLHIGLQRFLSIICQQFQQLAKRVCRKCILSSRVRPRHLRQKMTPLHSERVTIAVIFYNVGVDYAGSLSSDNELKLLTPNHF